MFQRLVHVCIAIYLSVSVLFTTTSFLSSSNNSTRWPWPASNTIIHNHGPEGQIILKSTDLGHHSIEESIMLSKAFPHLMKPSQIIPYYYRATGTFNKEDITITSLITSNRFEILARLVERYQGSLLPRCICSMYATRIPTRPDISNIPHQQRNRRCPSAPRLFA